MFVFDLKQKKYLNTIKLPDKLDYDKNALEFENGRLHIIVSGKHFVFNANDDKPKPKIYHDFKCEIWRTSMLYVKSKQMLLLIGGQDIDSDWKPFGIWRFLLKSEKWEKLHDGNTFGLRSTSCVLTAREDYVIITGDVSYKGHVMYVLDMRDEEEFKVRECAIKTPEFPCYGMDVCRVGGSVKNELLINGWIKELFKDMKFNDLSLPPMYIIQLIEKWYDQEEIHLVKNGESFQVPKDHYCIKLRHILTSLL